MSRITINSNIASLNAQQRLADSTMNLKASFERLSSGLRINRASDDAAGLAIASSLATDERVFRQGLRNINDAAALLNIADSALEQLSSVLTRGEELATQAANGTLSNVQRRALDDEAQALAREFSRLIENTAFNGQMLLNGELEQLRTQAGYGDSGAIMVGIGGARGSGEFELPNSVAVGNDPSDVEIADLNNDGYLDLVSSDYGDDTLSIVFGSSDGHFGGRVTIGLIGSPEGLALGDLNGDGICDIAVSEQSTDALELFYGRGDGTFYTGVNPTVGAMPWEVLISDFNGDNKADLAMTARTSGQVNILLADGMGGYTNAAYTVGSSPVGMTSDDFNNDGALDLAVAVYGSNSVTIMLGSNDGSFTVGASMTVGSGTFDVGSADFNGDGVKDLAVAARNSDSAHVLLGVGDGSFRSPINFSGNTSCRGIAIADFNGDGHQDFATANEGDDVVGLYFGNGDGTFLARQTSAAGTGPYQLSAQDINGDGVTDLVAAANGGGSLSVLHAKTTPGVQALESFSLAFKYDSLKAIEMFKKRATLLSLQRGGIGALQSRLSTAAAALQQRTEDITIGRSRIMDADIALEAANLVKNQILQQAGASILAQANAGPELALFLLGGN